MAVKFLPYIPATSLGDELAIIIAFTAAMIGTVIIYSFFWRIRQKRNHEEDLARRKLFQSRTAARAPTFNFDLHLGTTATVTAGSVADSSDIGTVLASSSGASVYEKMMDRFAIPENRAELPVHGMEMVGLRR